MYTLLSFFVVTSVLLVATTFMLNNQNELLVGELTISKRTESKLNNQKELLVEELTIAKRTDKLSLLVSGMAHDLNNILTPLRGIPTLLKTKFPADSKERRLLDQIEYSAARGQTLTHNFLLASRRGIRIDKESVSLKMVVTEFLNSPELSFLKRRYPMIELVVNTQNATKISGNTAFLISVLVNLVKNAFESIPDEGEVTITTKDISLEVPNPEIGIDEAGEYTILEVADSGTGVSNEIIDKVFEPFVSSKVLGNSSGAGIGMMMVKNVVEDHKGSIKILTGDSGTTFTLYFRKLEL